MFWPAHSPRCEQTVLILKWSATPLCHLDPILATRCALDLIIRPFPVCSSSKVLLRQDGRQALLCSSSTTAGRERIDFATWITTFKATIADRLTPFELSCRPATVTSCYLLLPSCLPTSQTSRTPCLKIFGQLTSSETLPTRRDFAELSPMVFSLVSSTSASCFHYLVFIGSYFSHSLNLWPLWSAGSWCHGVTPGPPNGVVFVLSQTGACPIVIK